MSFVEARAIAHKATNEKRGLEPAEVASIISNTPAAYRSELLEIVNESAGGLQARSVSAWAESRADMERDLADAFAIRQAHEDEVRTALAASPLAAVLTAGSAATSSQGEWRSLLPSGDEYRANMAGSTAADGGYTVPTKVATDAILQLRQRSVFLSAPGLNIVPFEGGAFVLPGIGSWSDATVVAENATIPGGTQAFTGASFTPIKFADLRWASSEVLADSAVDLRRLIATEMVRNIGQAVDKSAFGAGNGITALRGFTVAGQSTNTALSAGSTVVKWDHVIDAFASVMAAGATPTVIWASADMYGPLLRERESGASGAYLQGSVTSDPAKAALGLPILVSGNLPVRTVIVADASRCFVGVRSDVAVKVSEDAGFATDAVGFRATYRVAGLVVAEAGSVQRITAAAA